MASEKLKKGILKNQSFAHLLRYSQKFILRQSEERDVEIWLYTSGKFFPAPRIWTKYKILQGTHLARMIGNVDGGLQWMLADFLVEVSVIGEDQYQGRENKDGFMQ
jgi:hypothetical protein